MEQNRVLGRGPGTSAASLECLAQNPGISSRCSPSVASVTLIIARLAVNYVNIYASQARGVLLSTTIFTNLTRMLVYIIGLLVILQSLGISIMPILTALGVGGLAVAPALQDTLSNLFAGLQIIGSGQVKPGDFILAGERRGGIRRGRYLEEHDNPAAS
jgi:small-conductance mechanosensitive channel